ncbi:hypothetical protein DNTS_017553 [Danionella cerebrum]|uniref:SCP domain-containing protein n=1 Tax=Danionella cerebrum TaxID=2873325 RepID=A0A553RG61_9TELE|nr:hypothetical protein DNTS_017553 [Danionella translucida]
MSLLQQDVPASRSDASKLLTVRDAGCSVCDISQTKQVEKDVEAWAFMIIQQSVEGQEMSQEREGVRNPEARLCEKIIQKLRERLEGWLAGRESRTALLKGEGSQEIRVCVSLSVREVRTAIKADKGAPPVRVSSGLSAIASARMFRNLALSIGGLFVLLSLAVPQITEQQMGSIVNLHNILRSRVQPPAAFMKKMVWDESLRIVAEAYAAKCIWEHNPELDNLDLGENLFVSTGMINVSQGVQGWFDEYKNYDYNTTFCEENKMCGHYTQLVWADTSRIGCATHKCDTLKNLNFRKATILVCDYYPPGNYEGEQPYTTGMPCSKCPEHLPVCEDHLCVAENLSEDPNGGTEKMMNSTERPQTSAAPTDTSKPTDHQETLWRSAGYGLEKLSGSILVLVWLLVAVAV